MGPAIRHATSKLEQRDSKVRILFLVSAGRPQDHGYGRDRTEKEYAIHDTKMALNEAKRKGIVPLRADRGPRRPRLPQDDVRGHRLRGRGRHRVPAQPPADAVPQAHRVATASRGGTRPKCSGRGSSERINHATFRDSDNETSQGRDWRCSAIRLCDAKWPAGDPRT